MAIEYQRYGRNKETIINKTYIESGEYRRKFDKITDNPEVNRTLYECSKKALEHRNGTLLEDMYWIDENTGKISAKEISSTIENKVIYSDSTRKAIKSSDGLIAIHTHPESMPPSIEDFNSCYKNGYSKGVVACHDGKVFVYSSMQELNVKYYELNIGEFLSTGYSEYEAQFKTLEKIKKYYSIDFKEVL